MTTCFAFSIFVGALAAEWLLWAKFLQWGVRWAKRSIVTYRRALLYTVLIRLLVGTPVSIVPALATTANETGAIVIGAVVMLVGLTITWAIIRWGFRMTAMQAVKAWLPTLVPSFGMVLFVLTLVRPFLVEAFVIPTNSMAPTLLGHHCIGTCPRCGSLAYGSGPNRDDLRDELHPMICTKELALCEVRNPPGKQYRGDRILVCKLWRPRRWDLMVYRFPENPDENYVHRVAGLPGEELYIDDGFVWVNGKKLEPPEPIRNLRYLNAEDIDFSTGWADKDAPVQLGLDEYFVLGDFSARSRDSRLWYSGAPGHHPYAVPASHVIGVVTHIYWPPRRWRIIR